MQETKDRKIDSTVTTLDEVRQRFAHDRFATVNGAVIEAVDEGYARCSMQLNDTHRNALGAVIDRKSVV